MIESLKSELKVSDFIIGAIERFHLVRNDSVKPMQVAFKEMNVNWSTWGDRYDVANDYLKKQTRENKINQII